MWMQTLKFTSSFDPTIPEFIVLQDIMPGSSICSVFCFRGWLTERILSVTGKRFSLMVIIIYIYFADWCFYGCTPLLLTCSLRKLLGNTKRFISWNYFGGAEGKHKKQYYFSQYKFLEIQGRCQGSNAKHSLLQKRMWNKHKKMFSKSAVVSDSYLPCLCDAQSLEWGIQIWLLDAGNKYPIRKPVFACFREMEWI